jgi:26S proteasome regulatory subunit N2
LLIWLLPSSLQDAILRYGGIYTIAMAYAGTSNNQAIRKVLDVAVSDVSDDVRRAAVTALGFILFKNPSQVPRIVQLLSESYNPHVRQGAALALGISCAGTGLEVRPYFTSFFRILSPSFQSQILMHSPFALRVLQEAVEILEPLSKDPVDFVRQGALVSLAMVLVQQTEAQNPKVTDVRKTFSTVIGDKHEDSMAKFGAALGQGILDAGGRNVTISLVSRSGAKSMSAVVGMALFTQFWYWFPLAHCLSLGFAPTAVVGLDVDLKVRPCFLSLTLHHQRLTSFFFLSLLFPSHQMPKFDFISKAKPSLYAYPAPLTVEKKEAVKTVETAVLSTTAKANARAAEKKKVEQEKEGGAMDTDDQPTSTSSAAEPSSTSEDVSMTNAAVSSSTDPSAPKDASSSKSKPEPSTSTLTNQTRVTPAQSNLLAFSLSGSRYVPVRSDPSTSSSTPTPSTATKGKKLEYAPKSGRGMGILMMFESSEGEGDKEFIELEASLDRVGAAVPIVVEGDGAAGAAAAAPATVGAGADEDDGPEREAPASFEYPFDQ